MYQNKNVQNMLKEEINKYVKNDKVIHNNLIQKE